MGKTCTSRRRNFAVTALLTFSFACISSETDPRCTIDAPEQYRAIVAQCVNASEFWGAYFDALESTAPGEPLVAFRLNMNRRVTRRSTGGDYDPGVVDVAFSATNLRTGRRLYERETTVRLDDVIFGFFDENATRQEIQEAAFEATEEKIYPHIEIWVNVAALRAMGQEGSNGSVFVPLLEKTAQNPWGEDIPDAAKTALDRIRGRS